MLEGVAQGRQHNDCHDDMRNDKMPVERHVPCHGTRLSRLSYHVDWDQGTDTFLRH